MAGQKRGFGRERRNAMKVAVAVVSVCGFGATWYALGQGHPPLVDTPIDSPASVTPAPTGVATPADHARTGNPTGQSTPAPLATRRARTSRGS